MDSLWTLAGEGLHPRSDIALASRAIVARTLLSMQPPSRMLVSEWADARRVLSTAESGRAGQWRSSVAPYLIEPMNELSPTCATRTVVMMFASQLGKTEAELNALGAWIELAPGPMMVVMPSDGLVKDFVRTRLDRMIESTPTLRAVVREKKTRDSSNTLRAKSFYGGHILARSAGAGSQLQSAPIRYLVMDEVDSYEAEVEDAGDPVANATQRTAGFDAAKIVLTSTPRLKSNSRIATLYEQSDQRRYWVPCQRCGKYQLPEWGDFIWSSLGRPPSGAAYRCPDCLGLTEQHELAAMNARGVWVPSVAADYTVSGDGTIETDRMLYPQRGYYLPGWHSPWQASSWGVIATEFQQAQGDPARLQAWTNLREGRPYNELPQTNKMVDPHGLRGMVEPDGPVPAPAIVLTAGTDIHPDRWEMGVWAWGPGEESWVVDHVVHAGDPATDAFWQALDHAIETRYARDGGGLLAIQAACIDTGHMTDRVLAYTQSRGRRRIWAIRGLATSENSRAAPPIWPDRARTTKRHQLRYDIGVDQAKDVIMARLLLSVSTAEHEGGGKVPLGTRAAIHLRAGGPRCCDEEWCAQLVAEARQQKIVRGRRVSMYVQLRQRNEALDCAVYALAALRGLQRNDTLLRQMLEGGQAAVPVVDLRDEAPTSAVQPGQKPTPAPRPKPRPPRDDGYNTDPYAGF